MISVLSPIRPSRGYQHMIGQATLSIPVVIILAHVSIVDDRDPAIFLDGRGGDLVYMAKGRVRGFSPLASRGIVRKLL